MRTIWRLSVMLFIKVFVLHTHTRHSRLWLWALTRPWTIPRDVFMDFLCDPIWNIAARLSELQIHHIELRLGKVECTLDTETAVESVMEKSQRELVYRGMMYAYLLLPADSSIRSEHTCAHACLCAPSDKVPLKGSGFSNSCVYST